MFIHIKISTNIFRVKRTGEFSIFFFSLPAYLNYICSTLVGTGYFNSFEFRPLFEEISKNNAPTIIKIRRGGEKKSKSLTRFHLNSNNFTSQYLGALQLVVAFLSFFLFFLGNEHGMLVSELLQSCELNFTCTCLINCPFH